MANRLQRQDKCSDRYREEITKGTVRLEYGQLNLGETNYLNARRKRTYYFHVERIKRLLVTIATRLFNRQKAKIKRESKICREISSAEIGGAGYE